MYQTSFVYPTETLSESQRANYETACEILQKYRAHLVAISGGEVEQGSDEWKIQRAMNKVDGEHFYCIGGSEIYNLNDPAMTSQLLTKKVNWLKTGQQEQFASNEDATAPQWGKVTEGLLSEFVEHFFGVRVLEVPASVPHPTNKHFRYSPDGIAIMKYRQNVDGVVCDFGFMPVIMEFKNPFSRRANKDTLDVDVDKLASTCYSLKDIPEHYIPQVLSGPDTIPQAIGTLYAEGNWCVQTIENYGKNVTYCTAIHYKSNLNGHPRGSRDYFSRLALIDSRMIGFVIDSTLFAGYCGKLFQGMLVVSNMNVTQFYAFMNFLGRSGSWVYAPRNTPADAEVEAKYLADRGCTMIMPVSLLRFGSTFVAKCPNYIRDEFEQKITRFMNALHVRVPLVDLHASLKKKDTVN